MSGTLSGPGMVVRYSKIFGPSGSANNCWVSSLVRPEAKKSSTCPLSSRVTITPHRASISDRALSKISCNTVSRSRLSLMRRLASLNLERRLCGWSRSSVFFNGSPPSGCGIPVVVGSSGRRLMMQRDSRRGRPWRGQSYRFGQKIIIKLQKQAGKLPADYT